MKILGLDHLVLTVVDIETTCRFYERVLGMRAITFGEGRWALEFGGQKINLHQRGKEFEPKAQSATAGSANLCFITETPIDEVIGHIEACGVSIVEGPVSRSGARGPIVSVYLHDPDGNLIELASYSSTETGNP